MEKNEPSLPDFDQSQCLSPEMSAKFQETVVWTAIDYLWGGNFREECKPGNAMSKRIQMDIDGDVFCELVVEVDSPDESDADEDGENYKEESAEFWAGLSIDEKSDEDVIGMVLGYRSENFVRQHKKDISKRDRRRLERRVANEIEELSYEVRSITTYSFGLLDNSGFSVKRHQDLYQDGSCVWSTEKVPVGEEEMFDPLAEALNLEMRESVTYDDCFQIIAALEALKVPQELLRLGD